MKNTARTLTLAILLVIAFAQSSLAERISMVAEQQKYRANTAVIDISFTNTSDCDWLLGSQYRVQRKTAMGWHTISTSELFNALTFKVESGQDFSFSAKLHLLQEPLHPGKYRVLQEIFGSTGQNIKAAECIGVVEFILY